MQSKQALPGFLFILFLQIKDNSIQKQHPEPHDRCLNLEKRYFERECQKVPLHCYLSNMVAVIFNAKKIYLRCVSKLRKRMCKCDTCVQVEFLAFSTFSFSGGTFTLVTSSLSCWKTALHEQLAAHSIVSIEWFFLKTKAKI